MSNWYYQGIYGEKLLYISKYYKLHFGTLYFGDVEVDWRDGGGYMGNFLTRPSPWVCIGVLMVMGIATVCDIKTRTIPHGVPLLLGVIWVIDVCSAATIPTKSWKMSIGGSLMRSACMLMVLLATSKFFILITKQAGIGGGDIKMLSSLALILGFEDLCVVIFSACALSVMFFFLASFVNTIRKREGDKKQRMSSLEAIRKTTFPFAPFVSLGVVICFAVSYYL